MTAKQPEIGSAGQDRDAVASPSPIEKAQAMRQTIAALEKRIAEIETREAAEIRRLETILAEERHAALAARQRLSDLQQASKLSEETIHAIAMEVCFEQQRWSLPYKLSQWVRGLLQKRGKK